MGSLVTKLLINNFHPQKKVLGHLQPESNEQDHERLFREWFWALFGSLPLPHVVRIMDCYLIEGQKVLYRTSLALTRFFCKALKSKPTLSESVKKMGLVGAFHKFAAEVPVSPGSLLDKSFKFRDFGRAKIQKYFLRIETDIKARGLSAAHGDRSRSDDNLPSAKALDDIRKVSDTLSYKQVGHPSKTSKLKHHFQHQFLTESISSCPFL